jgi:hypothetical protein
MWWRATDRWGNMVLMRYGELDADPWHDCRAAWQSEGSETVEFLLVEPEPEHLVDVARTARRLIGADAQITEFNEEYMDQPVEDLVAASARVADNEAFFVNVSGEVGGVGVTISLGAENIIVKFAAAGVFGERDSEKPPEAFRALVEVALDMAESARAVAVCFGGEGVELAPEEGIHVWERIEREDVHSSDVRSLFADYVFTLDQRFAKKKYENAEELAKRNLHPERLGQLVVGVDVGGARFFRSGFTLGERVEHARHYRSAIPDNFSLTLAPGSDDGAPARSRGYARS